MELLYFNIENTKIAYQVYGQNNVNTLVFIHGFPFDQSMWKQQIDFFQKNFKIVTFDVRGHGNSEIGNKDFTINLLADDLIFLLDELNIQKAVICGLSMGGYIALNAVKRFPERFAALVLCDTTCKADTEEGKQKREQTKNVINQKGTAFYAEQSIPNLFAENSLINLENEVNRFKQMIIQTPVKTLVQTLTALAQREDTCQVLQNIKIPVLIVVGDQDKLTPVEAAKNMTIQLPSPTLCTIPEAGHISNVENPVVFNNYLSVFLSTINY